MLWSERKVARTYGESGKGGSVLSEKKTLHNSSKSWALSIPSNTNIFPYNKTWIARLPLSTIGMYLYTLQLQCHTEGLHDAVEWYLPDWEQFVSGAIHSRRRDETHVLSENLREVCLACARRDITVSWLVHCLLSTVLQILNENVFLAEYLLGSTRRQVGAQQIGSDGP